MEFINKHSRTISIVVAIISVLVIGYYINRKLTTLTTTISNTQREVSINSKSIQNMSRQSAPMDEFIYSTPAVVISKVQVDDFLMAQPEPEPEHETLVEEYNPDELDQTIDDEINKM